MRHTDGTRQPFLRGMVTHDLVQRGLPFDDAYAVARALTDRLGGHDEVTTNELRDLMEQELAKALTPEQISALELEVPAAPRLLVAYGGDAQPFSRGALAQSLFAAGIDLDRAYALVLDLQSELVREGLNRVDARELGLRVADLLERVEGKEAAARYRMMRALQRLPRPIVIYLGGAVGTGKSTLALQLAPLLRFYRINATDTIRQVMRMVFSPAMLPSLHRSSFELQDERELLIEGAGQEDDPSDALVRAFEAQAARVCVGVRGVVERSVAENTNVLVEGVHLLPSIVPFADLGGAAYQQMVMLSTIDEEVHRSFLLSRRDLLRRHPERYLESFAAIRLQQQHLLHLADDNDVPLHDSTERDT